MINNTFDGSPYNRQPISTDVIRAPSDPQTRKWKSVRMAYMAIA